MSDVEDGIPEDSKLFRWLACPYLAFNPREYVECYDCRLLHVKDVEQHLSQHHSMPRHYCERCLRVFPDRESSLRHAKILGGLGCKPVSPGIKLAGLSERQIHALSQIQMLIKHLSREQQWFEFWDIAFPGKRRPHSPYLDLVMPSNQYVTHPTAASDLPGDRLSRNPSPENAPKDAKVEGLTSECMHPPKDDIPFTDSGYASGFNPDHLLHAHLQDTNKEDDASRDSNCSHAARTSYSGASTIALDEAQRYISELSDSIYGQISGHIDGDNWASLSKCLPELIKAFAVKLGLESSSQINRDVMYFIHKRGREIAKQLDSRVLSFDAESNIAEECDKDKRDNMSLVDKIDLWNSKAQETQTSENTSELFVGVQDAEEEIIDTFELPNYNKTVVESGSFQWLIESLRKELSLKRDLDESRDRSCRESFRCKVIRSLPTGKMSKSRPPKTHNVTFRLLRWESFGPICFGGYGSNGNLSNAIAVTSCSGDAQETSIEEYMEQTWPFTWKPVCNLLQALNCDTEGHVYTATLQDRSEISASRESGNLVVRVTGPAHTIAECGEQLAWVQAASRTTHNVTSSIVRRVPLIVNMAEMHASAANSLIHNSLCFDIGIQETGAESLPDEERRLERILPSKAIVLVPGYPILRRPVAFHGIEVSPHYFLEAMGRFSRFPCVFRDGLVLNGPRRSLSLVKKTQNVYLWHYIGNFATRAPCDCALRENGDDSARKYSFDLTHIKTSRHIIGECEERETEEDSEPASPTLTDADMLDDDHSSCTIPASPPAEDRALAGSCGTTFQVCLTNTDGTLVSSFENDVESSSCFSRLHSPAATEGHDHSSPESSMDSDFFSASDSPDEVQSLDDLSPVAPVLRAVASRIFAGYRTTGHHGNSPNCRTPATVQATTSTSTNCSISAGAVTGLSQARTGGKRGRGDENAPPRPPPAKKVNTGPGKSLACPFWKSDHTKYRRCFGHILTRIRDVKQHLSRKHTPLDYCDRCLEIFPDAESHQTHVQGAAGRDCVRSKPLDGISRHQTRLLQRKSDRNLSEEEQWFAIWAILFPGRQRPNSAYMDAEVSEDLYLFQDYCRNHGETELQKAGLLGTHTSEEETQGNLRVLFSLGLDMLFQGWCSSRSSSSGSSSNAPWNTQDEALRPVTSQTRAGSITDSAVALGTDTPTTNSYSELYPLHDWTSGSGGQQATAEVHPSTDALGSGNGGDSLQFTGQALHDPCSLNDFFFNRPAEANHEDMLGTYNFNLSQDWDPATDFTSTVCTFGGDQYDITKARNARHT